MVVPVAFVSGMAVPVVDIVDMVVVRDGHMSAALTMGVVVSLMLDVVFGSAFVEVPVVSGV